MAHKFSDNVDIRTKCLVFGYIRNICVENHIIPSSIQLLCIKFYHCSFRIIQFRQKWGCVNTVYPIINIAELDPNKYYIPKFHSLNHTALHPSSTGNIGAYYVKNIQLPSVVISLSNNKLNAQSLYDIIFVVGSNKIGICYIIDINNIYLKSVNIYQLSLPPLLRNVAGPRVVYSPKYGLIDIGGRKGIVNGDNSNFNLLSFKDNYNIQNINEWKWKPINKMNRTRRYLTADMLNEDQLIICGGYNDKPFEYLSYSDIYDFKENKWITLPNMNQKRCRAGMLVEQHINKRVYVGGGKVAASHGLKHFEYYDTIKNNWIVMPETNGTHGANPAIWMENGNVLHIASVWGGVFEKMDLRQGKWTSYINSNKFGTVFGDQSISGHSSANHLLS